MRIQLPENVEIREMQKQKQRKFHSTELAQNS